MFTIYDPLSNYSHTERLNLYADNGGMHIEIRAVDLEHRDVETKTLHYMELDPFQVYLMYQTLTEWYVKYWLPSYNMSREVKGPSTR